MADSAWDPSLGHTRSASAPSRHPGVVRFTHWITAFCFFALLLSGIQILISHPRFYWGETGNVLTPALFELPIPASRSAVKTGYDYVLPDQNGWSRSMHFQAAWAVVLSGLVYGVFGFLSGHFRRNLAPARNEIRPGNLMAAIAEHLRLNPGGAAGAGSYNVLQRLAYLVVVFVLFPAIIWTGLAMSPGITSAYPGVVSVFGGQQSARTLHFFFSAVLVAFVVVHVAMVWLAGFRSRMKAMIRP